MYSATALLVHCVGGVALSQLLFSNQERYDYLNTRNTTDVLHDALDRIVSAFSLLPIVGVEGLRVGAVLRVAVYVIATLYGLYLARMLYSVLCGEFELYCPVVKAGFEFPDKKLSKRLVTKQDVVNEVRRRKQIGEIPPPYPNGWFCLLLSRELKPGASTSVNALGQNFAVFRDQTGQVHILDAYCAHLGANLGVGGVVHGRCIECPFHGWQFDGETGKCVKIPYTKGKIPDQAKVKAWPTLEVNGYILVWHDAEGRDPYWTTENLDGIENEKMVYRGSSTHFINAHIEDIPENGADVAHLDCLHGAGVSSGSDTNYKELLSGKLHTHTWTARWEALPHPSTHVGRMTLTMTNIILGLKVRALDITSVADQHGPGVVYLVLRSRFGKVYLLHTLTPQEPLLQKYSLLAYSDWWIPTFIVKWMVQGYDVQLERDMIAWNNKRYRLKPLLVKEDDLILKHRRWYSQFYSENSKRFTFKKEEDLSF